MESHALAIIESYCGQLFTPRQVNERIPLNENIGRLTHEPFVKIDAIEVRASEWAHSDVFGATNWASISPGDVIITNHNFIVVPGGFLGGHYTEADVTYTVGYAELPEAVRAARDILVRHMNDTNGGARSAYSMSALITPEIADLLAPFNLNFGGER